MICLLRALFLKELNDTKNLSVRTIILVREGLYFSPTLCLERIKALSLKNSAIKDQDSESSFYVGVDEFVIS